MERWCGRLGFELALLLITACSADPGAGNRAPATAGSFGGSSVTGGSGGQAVIPGGMTPPPSGGAAGSRPPPIAIDAGTSPPATSMVQPVAIDECGNGNPAGLDAAAVSALRSGGDPTGLRYLYPYEGTVFPRGMLAPELMWEGPQGDAVYIHIHSSLFDYQGCLPVKGPGLVQLPQKIWERAGDQTKGANDPFTIELTVRMGSSVKGPIVEPITIAQATLKGSIYYNSYVSAGSFSGTIFRIPRGGQAEAFIGGDLGCYGCHAVSANGQRLIAHNGGDPGLSYALDPMSRPNPPQLGMTPLAGFVGLSPDGSLYVASAHPGGDARPQGTPNEAVLVNDAALYETDTGMMVNGSGIPGGAMMPTFSPDGTTLAFNDYAAGQGRGLSIMIFDRATRTASGNRKVYTDTDRYPGWPFFLPDTQALVFARGENPQFSGDGAGVVPGLEGLAPASDLYLVDLDTGTTTILARAMGLRAPDDSTGYLPFGAEDLHKHYYPTVSPVSAGGYFWLFFDSMRHYGNQGLLRQLWGTALTVSADGSYTGDPSHPAFYVTGQELGSGNHRAFAALDPCRADGQSCETGIDCCSGFCTDGICGPPKGCAKVNEACKTSHDCCDPSEVCIAGFCGTIIVE